jgi:hypothetical protein
VLVGLGLEGNAFDDLDAAGGEPVDLARVVGHQRDPLYAEIAQDGGGDVVPAGVVGEAEEAVRLDRIDPVLLQSVGAHFVAQANPSTLLAQVNDDPPGGGRDRAHRLVELIAAVAFERAHDFAGPALGVDTHEHRGVAVRSASHVSDDESDVLVGWDARRVAVDDRPHEAVFGRRIGLCVADHQGAQSYFDASSCQQRSASMLNLHAVSIRMDLTNLIETRLDLAALSKDLDEIGPFARLWSVRQWTRAHMATLWEAAKGFRPVSLDDFVPPTVAPLVQVIHDGKNSLPLHTSFQKRFCRPRDPAANDTLLGYNHQSLSPVTGPGYFVARPSTEGGPGEVDIDYTRLPREKPDGWPDVLPNEARLGRFVYSSMVDVMRGLSSHVSVGRAKRVRRARSAPNGPNGPRDPNEAAEPNGASHGSRWMNAWFVLVRRDAASDGHAAGGVDVPSASKT